MMKKRGKMPKKILLAQAFLVMAYLLYPTCGKLNADPSCAGEKITYLIDPVGIAKYQDLGIVEVEGIELHLVTFETKMFGFRDTEKIYTDPKTRLPVRVERNLTLWTKKEYLVEEYDQEQSHLSVKKYNNKKKVKEYFFKAKGPIHNAVLLPFFLRDSPEFRIGWSMEASFPQKFEIQLVSIEEIQVPAGKFWAYHFTSIPHKFDIWISRDSPRVPLKIQGMGALGYTIAMKERHNTQD
ncbi:MAG: hypothetical protein V1923_02700 [Candidatus Omnitrophota bacterium]